METDEELATKMARYDAALTEYLMWEREHAEQLYEIRMTQADRREEKRLKNIARLEERLKKLKEKGPQDGV